MTWNSGAMLPGGKTMKEAEEEAEREEVLEADYVSDLDAVYRERNRMVAHLAAEYPSQFVLGADPQYPGWAIVFVKLPTGQVSWHVGPRDFDLFDFMPQMQGGEEIWTWDNHTTEEKYDRLDKYARTVYTARMATGMVGSLVDQPVTEIDDDFYTFGEVVMCRLAHDTAEGNILGQMPSTDDALAHMLSNHDRNHHDGP